MIYLGIDFETYWDTEYTLTKMPTQAYVCDARFENFGAGVKFLRSLRPEDDVPATWLRPDQIETVLNRLDPDDTCIIGQNLAFDGTILQHEYGFVPKMFMDSMSMGQFGIGHVTGRVSLAKLVEALGVGVKRGDVLHQTRGRRWHLFTGDERRRMAQYACEDTDQCVELVRRLLPMQTPMELWAQDWTVRAFVTRPLRFDRAALSAAVQKERTRKDDLLERTGLESRDALMSNDKFADLLRGYGIEPELKAGKKGPTYAFAKSDPFMKELLAHEDEEVAALAAARVGHKSTLVETRCARLLVLDDAVSKSGANRPVGFGMGIKYHAAHTGRFGGTDHLNWQNLDKKSGLRRSIVAPDGFELFVADYGQIEARTLAWFALEEALIELFGDPTKNVYCAFGTDHIYHRPVYKDDSDEYKVSKAGVLALGFGQGPSGFYNHCRRYNIKIDEGLTEVVVDGYRTAYKRIGLLWKWGRTAIRHMGAGRTDDFAWGPPFDAILAAQSEVLRLATGEVRYPVIRLPSGRRIAYMNLRQADYDPQEWVFDKRPGQPAKLWHGLLTENFVQATARDLMLNGARNVERQMGLRCVFTSHDEMMWVIPTDGMSSTRKKDVQKEIEHWLCVPPAWGQASASRPAIPLTVASNWGKSYADAK